MATFAEKLGAGLQGFGAGVRGRGSEFLAQQDKRKDRIRKLSKERQAKLLQDFVVLDELVNVRNDEAGGIRFIATRIKEINRLGGDPTDSIDIQGALLSTDPDEREEAKRDIAGVIERGKILRASTAVPPSALDVARTGQATAAAAKTRAETIDIESGKGRGGLASAKTEILADGTVIQALPGGGVDVRDPSGNLVTGAARLDVLANSEQFELTSLEKKANIAVKKAESIATATNRASRVSALTSELSGKSRAAKRGAINLNQAANLIEKAVQGLSGKAKVLAGRIFPGIDVTNEGALEQSLKLLALDELQKFKGPTTDFEFRVTEDIAGSLGSGRAANRARVRSLQRAGWFVRREFEQFQAHVKSGGDPDDFGFNFGESIKTKKGIFTLQDLQDTAVDNNLSIEETLKRLNK